MGRKTAREIAEEITGRKRKPEFLGKKTPQVLAQELFSLHNTKAAFRKPGDNEKIVSLTLELASQHGIKNWRTFWNNTHRPGRQ